MENRIDAIYARQSVDRKDSISIESQIEFCKYELRGGNHKDYQDKGYAGKNTDRPKFQELLADIRQGLIRRDKWLLSLPGTGRAGAKKRGPARTNPCTGPQRGHCFRRYLAAVQKEAAGKYHVPGRAQGPEYMAGRKNQVWALRFCCPMPMGKLRNWTPAVNG